MFDLIATRMQHESEWDTFRSHPHKFLRVHTHGVLSGVQRRTHLSLPQVAAIFHDLGKLNPNFQPKLDNEPASGYSSHAYLSAWAFLRFCQRNSDLARSMGVVDQAAVFTVVTLIAHHHGSLPDLREILNIRERERMADFLQGGPELSVSDYLKAWLDHQHFVLWDSASPRMLEQCAFFKDEFLNTVKRKLDFFLSTQFGFAALLEADKRDAGDNKWFRRSEQLAWMQENFAPKLRARMASLSPDNALNRTRTAIREEAARTIEPALVAGERVFSLTAPTGAGKTYALLSLAEIIRRHVPEASLCYALPFLTITEQVENICQDIYDVEIVTRLDSRSQNESLDRLLTEIEADPSKGPEILKVGFSDETFDAAFIVTTFVQVFETLLTNRGSTLMRLPNFAKTIFLIDEIQALPPRLYVFFAAYLRAFCEKFDCYAVLSTATMPAFDLPAKSADAHCLFPDYKPPKELVDFETHYQESVFDRYVIRRVDGGHGYNLAELADALTAETQSCLVILNTIDDTRRLYEYLCPVDPQSDVRLLNTRFVLDDRKAKIAWCQARLAKQERIILISTQLIEAGVDIDFPVVYRDLCPLPSVIQSAGRCNRNGRRRNESGNLTPGEVRFFELLDADTGKPRAALVYRDPADAWSLNFSRNIIIGEISERDLLQVQRQYFREINQNLKIGGHRLKVEDKWKSDNLVSRIQSMAFEIVGSFRLIDEEEYGLERRYYVATSEEDQAWERLGELAQEVAHAAAQKSGYEEVRLRQTRMFSHLRTMSGRVVQIRFHSPADAPPAVIRNGEVKEYCRLCKLLHPAIDYDSEEGLKTHGTGIAIF